MRILFASSEVVPFSKTGGLADVSGALPTALAKRGHEVVVITPRYHQVDVAAYDLRRKRTRLSVPVKGKPIHGGILEGRGEAGVTYLFVDQPGYFDRDGLYGTDGKDFADNDERFAFFSRAVFESCRLVGMSPDIIHCNDWQTGPIPALLQFEYRDRPELNSTGSVMTIHNLGFQGLFPPETMITLGLDWNLFTPSNLEYYGQTSYLKAGLIFADKLTTVSKKYAQEIQTPAMGFGMNGLLEERATDLRGILNGVDYGSWDPKHDKLIAARYTAQNLTGKGVCKTHLQQHMGLPANPEIPLIGCVSRLTTQKGIDLFIKAAERLLSLRCQWVFLGSGDQDIEEALRQLADRHPQKIAVQTGYDDDLAHAIHAGADLYLMPSRYEPCGLNQMYALRYGAIPVVRAVGGLDDTIENVSADGGNGFKFQEASAEDLGKALDRALKTFTDRDTWAELVEYAMSQDFSWDRPSRQYEIVYQKAAALRNP